MVIASKTPSSSLPCYSDLPDTHVRKRDARFISQSELDAWVRERRVSVEDAVLTIGASGNRYVMRDAVRILGPSGRSNDLFGMTGRVVAIGELIALGASVSSSTMRLGTAEYDLQLGFILVSIESLAQPV